ncbi:MAG: hypothetical protein IPK72_11350 [Candidatus Eisenbacteria bacterium]|nr:hypothetical protein [Candidatus Eisenbacteria bacterium]
MQSMRHASPWIGLLVFSLSGCGDRDPVSYGTTGDVPEPEAAWSDPHDHDGPLLSLLGAKLKLSTDDPNQTYVEDDVDPWMARSVFTEASSFTLVITNESRQIARNLELLVAVPGNLPEFGWSVTVGDPGVLLSSLEDFPCLRLRESSYPPLPHGVYGPRGTARFARVMGPSALKPGQSWSVPVQIFRGAVSDFKVHFDTAGGRFFCAPMNDVTAVPPMEENIAGR